MGHSDTFPIPIKGLGNTLPFPRMMKAKIIAFFTFSFWKSDRCGHDLGVHDHALVFLSSMEWR